MENPYISAIYPLSGLDGTRPAAAFLDGTGKNTGNLIFSASVLRLVRGLARPPSDISDLSEISELCDGVVIAAANWLQPTRDMGEMAALIEALDMPTVVTGLGAQASADRIPDLPAGTVRFLKAVSERSRSISVRGRFSAEVLDHYGISNVTVTGCPSLLYHLTRPAQVGRVPNPQGPLRVAVNGMLPGSRVPERDSDRMALGRFMLQQAVGLGAEYVAQTELPLIRLARGKIPEEAPIWAFLAHVFGCGDGPEDRAAMRRYAEASVRVFGGADAWLDWAAGPDLVIGTRLHGVIAALLAGTPAILLTHDSRTAEMARAACLPALPAARVQSAGGLDPRGLLAELHQADAFAAFNRHQAAYFRDFMAFFDANEVPHRLSLSDVPPAFD